MRARVAARKGARPTRAPHVAGVPNATEAEYARLFLGPQRLLGEIERYEFEPETLALSVRLPKRNRCTYCPDYRVTLPDGRVEYHEVKGFLEEDAWVKFKWACEKYPQFAFVMATRQRKGKWRIQKFGGWEAGR